MQFKSRLDSNDHKACAHVLGSAITTCHPPLSLQVSPDTFVLVGGALTEVLLHFRPVAAGFKDIKV